MTLTVLSVAYPFYRGDPAADRADIARYATSAGLSAGRHGTRGILPLDGLAF